MDGNETHWIDDEDDLMVFVADALADVPAWVASGGRAVYPWQYIDAELAAVQALAMPVNGDQRDPQTRDSDPRLGESQPPTTSPSTISRADAFVQPRAEGATGPR